MAAGLKTTVTGYLEYNLCIKGIPSCDLVAKDETNFGKEVPLIIGTKTEDTITEALKEGEIELLDSVWKNVKMNHSFSKL